MIVPINSVDFSIAASRAERRARSNSIATWTPAVAAIGTLVFDFFLIEEQMQSAPLSLGQMLILTLVPASLATGAVITKLAAARHRYIAKQYRGLAHRTAPS